jgi:hypothetical protein
VRSSPPHAMPCCCCNRTNSRVCHTTSCKLEGACNVGLPVQTSWPRQIPTHMSCCNDTAIVRLASCNYTQLRYVYTRSTGSDHDGLLGRLTRTTRSGPSLRVKRSSAAAAAAAAAACVTSTHSTGVLYSGLLGPLTCTTNSSPSLQVSRFFAAAAAAAAAAVLSTAACWVP